MLESIVWDFEKQLIAVVRIWWWAAIKLAGSTYPMKNGVPILGAKRKLRKMLMHFEDRELSMRFLSGTPD